MRHRAEAKDILLECQVTKQRECLVLGDEGRLRQVLINLIGNAIKFTDRGSVRLAVEKGRSTINRHSFTFRITDTGVGISSHALEHLFEPFNQGDSNQNFCTHAGTGLGLAISQSLVQLMGGDITVTSEKGGGSEFLFTLALPLASPRTSAPVLENDLPTAIPERLNGRILVVDDCQTSRMVAKLMMEPTGLTVDIACEGEEAVRKVKKAITTPSSWTARCLAWTVTRPRGKFESYRASAAKFPLLLLLPTSKPGSSNSPMHLA